MIGLGHDLVIWGSAYGRRGHEPGSQRVAGVGSRVETGGLDTLFDHPGYGLARETR